MKSGVFYQIKYLPVSISEKNISHTLSRIALKTKNKIVKTITLLYPQFCVSCKRIIWADDYFCSDCNKDFIHKEHKRCSICNRILYHSGNCRTCNENKNYYDKGYTVFKYSNNVRYAILNFKYFAYRYAGQEFSRLMTEYIQSLNICNFNYDYVTAVPIYKSRLKKRGYNQAEILAKQLAKNIELEYKKLIIRTKKTKPLHGLNFKERRNEVKNAFAIINNIDIKNKNILIVDDILTTGSTINECCKVLKRNGAKRVDFFTLSCRCEE